MNSVKSGKKDWSGTPLCIFEVWKSSDQKWVVNVLPSSGGSYCGQEDSRKEALDTAMRVLIKHGEFDSLFTALFDALGSLFGIYSPALDKNAHKTNPYIKQR